MLDFAIIYENVSRELETAVFVKRLLIKKGYKAKVFHKSSLLRFFQNPKVIISPYLYSDKDCVEFNSFFKKKKRPIINLQYEQVLSNNTLASGFFNPKGDATNAFHISWGINTKKRLNSLGIDNTRVVGNISVVLNSAEFSCFYSDKAAVAREFRLDAKKRWLLFISSFSYATLSAQEIELIKRKVPKNSDFIDVSLKSREAIIDWLEEYCCLNPDVYVIYRPHPNEYKDHTLEALERKCSNFTSISKYSIRQWIKISDVVCTWFSTSLADVFFANKNCVILRPYPIPSEYESHLLRGAKYSRTKESSFNLLNSDNFGAFPLDKDIVSEYYKNSDASEVVQNFIKVCEEVISNPKKYECKYDSHGRMHCIVDNIFGDLCGTIKIYKLIGEKSNFYHFAKISYLNKKNIRKLMREYDKRFSKIV